MPEQITLIHTFIDHSNIWGGVRLASRVRNPEVPEDCARVSVRNLDRALGGRRQGMKTKIVSGGVPPGMEGLWAEYETHGYDTQRLFRDKNWKEHGVDHSIIGHMWRLAARYRDTKTVLVLASGDGKTNEFGTSFYEVLEDVLSKPGYERWKVELASFDWKYPDDGAFRSPTNVKMRKLVEQSPRGRFVNLFDHYDKIVYHEEAPAMDHS